MQVWLARAHLASSTDNGTNAALRTTQQLLKREQDRATAAKTNAAGLAGIDSRVGETGGENAAIVESYILRGMGFLFRIPNLKVAEKEIDSATRLIREALRLNPDCKEAMMMLKKVVRPVQNNFKIAQEHFQKREFAEALAAYSTALETLRFQTPELRGTSDATPSSTSTPVGAGAGSSSSLSDQIKAKLGMKAAAAAKAAEADKPVDPLQAKLAGYRIAAQDCPFSVALLAERALTYKRLYDSIKYNVAKEDVEKKEGYIKNCLKDCHACLRAKDGLCKVSLLTRNAIYLDQGRYEEAVRCVQQALAKREENNMAKDEAYRELREALKKAQFELKKSRRVDLYKIISRSSRTTPAAIEKMQKERGTRWMLSSMSSQPEIKAAYRQRCLELHPDKVRVSSGGNPKEIAAAEKEFLTVGEAYELLSDPQKRRLWDDGYTQEQIGEMCGR